MLKLQELVKRDQKLIAQNITQEQGKTLADAEGDVLRGLRELLWIFCWKMMINKDFSMFKVCNLEILKDSEMFCNVKTIYTYLLR